MTKGQCLIMITIVKLHPDACKFDDVHSLNPFIPPLFSAPIHSQVAFKPYRFY